MGGSILDRSNGSIVLRLSILEDIVLACGTMRSTSSKKVM